MNVAYEYEYVFWCSQSSNDANGGQRVMRAYARSRSPPIEFFSSLQRSKIIRLKALATQVGGLSVVCVEISTKSRRIAKIIPLPHLASPKVQNLCHDTVCPYNLLEDILVVLIVRRKYTYRASTTIYLCICPFRGDRIAHIAAAYCLGIMNR